MKTWINRLKRSLRPGTAIGIGGAALVVLIFVAIAYDSTKDRERRLALAERHNENLVHLLAEQTARTIDAIDHTLVTVADTSATPALLRDVMRRALATTPFVWGLLVTNAEGIATQVATTVPVNTLDLSDRAYFTEQRDRPDLGLYIGPPLLSRPAAPAAIPRYFVGMSRRLVTPDGLFAGVVVAAVDPQYFEHFYDGLTIGRDASVAMFLRDGRLIARRPHVEALVGKSFGHFSMFSEASRPAMRSMRTAAGIDGLARLISYHEVPGRPIIVAVTATQAETLARWWRASLIKATGGMILLAMLGLLTALLTRQVKRLADNEQRFRSLFEHNPDAVLLLGGEQVLDVNPAGERLFRCAVGELRAQSIDRLVDATDTQVRAAIDTHRRTGRFQGVLDLRRVDGTTFPAEVTTSRFRDGRGATRTVLIVRDISEPRRLATQLHLQAAALRAAANAIVITDRSGTIVWANPAATTLTGYSAAELIGQNPRLFKSERTTPVVYHDLWRTIATGRPWHGTLVNRRKDGTFRDEEMTITPVLDEGGDITHFIAIKQDITERVAADEEITRQHAVARQQEKLVEMGRMLAGVAHELNNPLAVVVGRSTMLREQLGDTPHVKSLTALLTAAERCARIVRNFLALAREYPPERGTVAINTTVRDTVELVAYHLRVENIAVVLDLDDDLPPLQGDSHQLQQVIVNLVTNAGHALRDTTTGREITIATRHDAARQRVVLEVRDTGPGISEHVRAHLFEPFVTTKPVGEGTGLGLSICKGIVEAHGGTIRVDSRPGSTRFIIELPILPAITAHAEAEALAPARRGLTALVIDDERAVAELLSEIATPWARRIDTAENGAAALQLLRDRTYDVIFCDLKMPLMDGQAFYAALVRERPQLASRVVFVTGDTFSSTTPAFLASAARPFINKPFTERDVAAAVATVTSGAEHN